MKTIRDYIFLRAFTLLGLGMCALFSAAAQTTPSITTRQYAFPPVGLGSLQTARVNVTNTAANASNGTAASCTGTILFMSSSGSAIGSPALFTVTSGQIFSASLPFASVPSTAASLGGTSTHTQFIATVLLNSSTSNPRPPCTLAITLELDDTGTGDVEVVLPTATLTIGPISVGPLF